ncbi:MAG: hypothetical protein ABR526_02370 [Chthoniobacterales bacterium]
MRNLRLIAAASLSIGATFLVCRHASAQEAVVEEVRVDGAFVASPFELRRDHAVEILTERMMSRAAELRAAELHLANENPATRLLELTKYIPIPLGSSENRVDTFFLSNYMRADLNPRSDNRLFGNR